MSSLQVVWNSSTPKNKWLLFEAIDTCPKDGQRIVEELAVVGTFNDGKEALAEYAIQHKKDKKRELYIHHTSNKELKIVERKWIGVRDSS